MGLFLIWLFSSIFLYSLLSAINLGPITGLVSFVLPLIVLAIYHKKKEDDPYKGW
jgi:hypothetical protein